MLCDAKELQNLGFHPLEDHFQLNKPVKGSTLFWEESSAPSKLHLLKEGIGIGFNTLADGRRQIVCLYLPGDLLDPAGHMVRRNNHNILFITKAVVGMASTQEKGGALKRGSELERWVLCAVAKKAVMLEQWVTTLGRRSAIERVAFFFCELHFRMGGEAEGGANSHSLSLTHVDMADLLGVSVVHTGRVLKSLREMGMASLENGRLYILDFQRLMQIAEFDPAYLEASAA